MTNDSRGPSTHRRGLQRGIVCFCCSDCSIRRGRLDARARVLCARACECSHACVRARGWLQPRVLTMEEGQGARRTESMPAAVQSLGGRSSVAPSWQTKRMGRPVLHAHPRGVSQTEHHVEAGAPCFWMGGSGEKRSGSQWRRAWRRRGSNSNLGTYTIDDHVREPKPH